MAIESENPHGLCFSKNGRYVWSSKFNVTEKNPLKLIEPWDVMSVYYGNKIGYWLHVMKWKFKQSLRHKIILGHNPVKKTYDDKVWYGCDQFGCGKTWL